MGYSFVQRIAAFWAKVNKDGPIPPLHPEMTNCWLWEGGKARDDYGTFSIDGSMQYAHRIAFLLLNGFWPEPEGDHLCHVHECVRPDHIRPATRQGNALNRAVKICKYGHPLSDPNLYYYGRNGYQARRCLTCIMRERERVKAKRKV